MTLARMDALKYGKGAGRDGGPREFPKMFCSQFVMAAYQAAAIAPQLAKNPKLSWRRMDMPAGLRIHAAHATPFAFHSYLREAQDEDQIWKSLGRVLVDAKAK